MQCLASSMETPTIGYLVDRLRNPCEALRRRACRPPPTRSYRRRTLHHRTTRSNQLALAPQQQQRLGLALVSGLLRPVRERPVLAALDSAGLQRERRPRESGAVQLSWSPPRRLRAKRGQRSKSSWTRLVPRRAQVIHDDPLRRKRGACRRRSRIAIGDIIGIGCRNICV